MYSFGLFCRSLKELWGFYASFSSDSSIPLTGSLWAVEWLPCTGIDTGQTELGLFLLFHLKHSICFYVILSWEKGRGQKERERRVPLCGENPPHNQPNQKTDTKNPKPKPPPQPTTNPQTNKKPNTQNPPTNNQTNKTTAPPPPTKTKQLLTVSSC